MPSILECVGLPFPGETVLIAASVIAGTEHDLNIVSVILTAGGASIIGRMIGYVIGREFGYWLLLRYGGYLWITESRIKLGQYLFLRHGGKVIVIAQFLPVLRSLAGILAGANRMPWPRFILTNIVGAFLWATLLGGALATLCLLRRMLRFGDSPRRYPKILALRAAQWACAIFGNLMGMVLSRAYTKCTSVTRGVAEVTWDDPDHRSAPAWFSLIADRSGRLQPPVP
jgi:membrane protein YqaA with SNARE-associated domain